MASTQNNIVATIFLENSEFKKALFEVQNLMGAFVKDASKNFGDLKNSFSSTSKEAKVFADIFKKFNSGVQQSSQSYTTFSNSVKESTKNFQANKSSIASNSGALLANSSASIKSGKSLNLFKGIVGSTSKAIQSMGSRISNTTNQYSSMGNALLRVGATLTGLNIGFSTIKAGIERFDIIQTFPRAMAAFGVSTEESAAQIKKLKDGILGLPPSLSDVVSDTKRLYQALGSLDKATGSVIALQSAFAAAKSKTDEQARAMDLYTRALAKGKIDIYAFTDLQQAMGKGFLIVAEKLGYSKNNMASFQEAVTKGRISATEFNDALIDSQGALNSLAQETSGGIMVSLSNINNRLNSVAETLITKFSQALKDTTGKDLSESLNSLGESVSKFGTKIKENNDILEFFKSTILKIKEAFIIVQGIVGTVAEFFKSEVGQKIIKTISDLAPKVLSTQLVLMGFGLVVKGLISPFTLIITQVTNVIKTFSDLGKGAATLFKFFAANPFILLIGALVGLVAIIIMNWDTISSFLKDTWDKISGFALSTFESIKNFIMPIFDTIGGFIMDVWKGIADFIIPLWDNISSTGMTTFEALKAIILPVWDAISAGIDQALNFLQPVWDEIVNIFNEGSKWFQETFGPIMEDVGKAFDEVGKTFGTVGAELQKTFNDIWEFCSPIWTQFTTDLTAAWDGFWTLISPLINFLRDLFMQVFGFLAAVVPPIWDGIMQGLLAAWNVIWPVLQIAFEVFKNLFSTVFNFLASVVPPIWNAIMSGIIMAWNIVSSVLGPAWEGFKILVGIVFGVIKTVILGAWNIISSTTSFIWNGIKKAVEIVWNGLKTGVTTAFNFIKGIIEGVWNGISGTTKKVWDSIMGTLNWVWDTIKTTVQKAWDAITKPIWDAWNGLKGIFDTVMGFFGGGGAAPAAAISASMDTYSNDLAERNYTIGGNSLKLYDFKNFKNDFEGFNFEKLEPRTNIEVSVYLDSDELITKTKKNMDTALGYQVKLQKRRGLI